MRLFFIANSFYCYWNDFICSEEGDKGHVIFIWIMFYRFSRCVFWVIFFTNPFGNGVGGKHVCENAEMAGENLVGVYDSGILVYNEKIKSPSLRKKKTRNVRCWIFGWRRTACKTIRRSCQLMCVLIGKYSRIL